MIVCPPLSRPLDVKLTASLLFSVGVKVIPFILVNVSDNLSSTPSFVASAWILIPAFLVASFGVKLEDPLMEIPCFNVVVCVEFSSPAILNSFFSNVSDRTAFVTIPSITTFLPVSVFASPFTRGNSTLPVFSPTVYVPAFTCTSSVLFNLVSLIACNCLPITTSVESLSILPSATLVIFVPPALIPSLPIVIVFVLPSACLLAMDTLSPSIVSFVPAPSAVVALVIDVIPVRSFTIPISSLPSTFLVRMLFAAVVASAATVPSPTISNFAPKSL